MFCGKDRARGGAHGGDVFAVHEGDGRACGGVEEGDGGLMRGDGGVLVKDGDEFDGHVALGHVGGHTNENAFRCDGLVARRHIELTCADGFETVFKRGEEFVRVEQCFYFFAGEDEHDIPFVLSGS